MKKVCLFAVLAIIAVVCLQGCRGDSSSSTPQGSVNVSGSSL